MVRIPRPHRRPIRHVMAATVILAIAVPLTLARGPALASSLSCGAAITTNTTLHADLTNCAGDGLVIGADNITLNLNGHTIAGDATPGTDPDRPDRGIRLEGHHGVTIERGTVQDFDANVGLDAASGNHIRALTLLRAAGRGLDAENGSDGDVIENSTSAHNGRSGFALIDSSHNLVRDNTALDNASNGVFVRSGAHNQIQHNRFARDLGGDVALAAGASDNHVIKNTMEGGSEEAVQIDGSRNLISRNRMARLTGDGIGTNGDDNLITGNEISDVVPECDGCGTAIGVGGGMRNLVVANRIARTGVEGIRIDSYPPETPPTIGTIVRANLIQNAGTDGIAVGTDPGSGGPTLVIDTLLQSNIVTGSGHDGINTASAATTLTRNLALRNRNLGIEAVPGTIDGGGNHAFGNGNPLQCINIAC
jgi:parallel beta-helix repeat protein